MESVHLPLHMIDLPFITQSALIETRGIHEERTNWLVSWRRFFLVLENIRASFQRSFTIVQ